MSENNKTKIDIAAACSGARQIRFVKMHGCGNDYIYIDLFDCDIADMSSVAIALSDRHCGVGGDGVIFICPSDTCDARMRMFNSDGSEGKMCGNGIRCVGKYLYDSGRTDKTDVTVDTLSGVKHLRLFVRDGKVTSVRVDMGKAIFDPRSIPVAFSGDRAVDRKISTPYGEFGITCISMGNPHCAIFVDDVFNADVKGIGGAIGRDTSLFPEGVNVGFVQVVDRTHIKLRVYERGTGETMACGSGACAAAVAAVVNGKCDKDADITVSLPGGELTVRYTDVAVYLTGEACEVFRGIIDTQLLTIFA